ncbi:hypothetical protein JCM16358_22890 [Halanaerocella petrolearia]
MMTIGEALKSKQPTEHKKLILLKTKLQYRQIFQPLFNSLATAARNMAQALIRAFKGVSANESLKQATKNQQSATNQEN